MSMWVKFARAVGFLSLAVLLIGVGRCRPSGDIRIHGAKWEAGDSRIRVDGDSDAGAGVAMSVSNAFTGEAVGTAQTDAAGQWVFECGGGGVPCGSPSRVPCAVQVSGPGLRQDLRALKDAPLDCALRSDVAAPTCSIVQPAADLRGPDAIDPGTAVSFVAEASDAAGRSLSFAWDFAGGADARPSGPAPAPVVFDAEGSFRVVLRVATPDGASCSDARLVDVGSLPSGLPAPVAQQPAHGQAGSGDGDHVVIAWNDLGMHCADLGSVPFSILPPFSTVNAHALRRGTVGPGRPQLLDDGDVELVYSASSNPQDPVGPDSINSTSQNFPVGASVEDAQLAKTDFWDFLDGASVVSLLFPGLDPVPDEGLQTLANLDHGRRMPGIDDPFYANDPQEFSGFEESRGWFTSQGMPFTHIDDAGRRNSYPLIRVQAVDGAGGNVLATVDAVVPVSSEVDCRDCHSLDEVAADPGARPAGPAFVAPDSPERRDVETAAKTNILRLHDANHAAITGVLDGGDPELCATCHASAALSSVGGPAGDPSLSSMSEAMHAYHGSLQVDAGGALLRDGAGVPVLRDPSDPAAIPLIPSGPGVPMEQNCFLCHPGKITQCFRGAMFAAGSQCGDCHGGMLAVGGVHPLLDGDAAPLGPRRPWLDEPRCESCHTGDAVDRLPGKVVRLVAFDPDDPAATPTLATNRRFAEEPGTLYRESRGHGGLACEACHGSPHAIWPNPDPDANDNVPARQLQGHAGALSECSVCHQTPFGALAGLGGPHGMHAVGDPGWIKGEGDWHGEVYGQELERSGQDACAACHGADHRGRRLARTSADRVLRDDEGTVRAIVPEGTVISCGLCHTLAKSFED